MEASSDVSRQIHTVNLNHFDHAWLNCLHTVFDTSEGLDNFWPEVRKINRKKRAGRDPPQCPAFLHRQWSLGWAISSLIEDIK